MSATLFDGLTYSPAIDADRLTTQLGRVYRLMIDGKWRTLAEIASHVGGSEAGVSEVKRFSQREDSGHLRDANSRARTNRAIRAVGLQIN